MMTLEAAKPRDLPLLFQLNKTLIDQYEDISAIDYDRVLAWVEKNLEISLPHFRKILWNGKVAGFFCLIPGDSSWELDSLFVFPEFQGMGIGTQVLRHCQTLCPRLLLYVFRENVRAVSLYQRMGFCITKKTGKTRYIMEWKNQD